MYAIRPIQVPADYPHVVEMLNVFRSAPVTTASLLDDDSKTPPAPPPSYDEEGRLVSHVRDRFVATDAAGQPVGYLHVGREPWTEPGLLIVSLIVDPQFRGRGVGRQLAAFSETHARGLKAAGFKTKTREGSQRDRRFAEQHGYSLDYHLYESMLDVGAFDGERFAGTVERVKAAGIRFYTLADEPGDKTEHALFAIDRITTPDVPHDDGAIPVFSEWRKRNLEVPGFDAEYAILAAHGEQVVGATWMFKQPATGALYTSYTCTLREYRGRQIGLALKLLAIETARRHQIPCMRTHNNSLNGPMLAVNRKLGYQPVPGWYYFRKSL